MRIAIIGAMDQEVQAFLSLMTETQTIHLGHLSAHQGNYFGHDTLVTQSGIGKVHAAITTTRIIDAFHPELIINIGSAGGLHESLSIGDIVIADQLSYHDVDVRAFGYAFGQVPSMPLYYTTDANLLKTVQSIEHDRPLHIGLICSGDTFLSSTQQLDAVKTAFPTIYAVDMESCAIAQTCHQYGVPLCVIRAISDHANHHASANFEAFLETASINSAALTTKMISALKT